ncbi:MAG: M20/M25/M40 family metallo-hydrolase [Anaerovoracaceae bacterium]
MEQRILKILTELTALKSRSGTADENLASDYIYEYIKGLDYFRKHREDCNLIAIEEDPAGRHIPYGLIRGRSGNTVILSGHFDVVDEFDYGEAKPLAFTIGKELEEALKRNPMNREQKEDMDSGEWIWAKGAADMKGGLAIHMALLEEFSQQALKGELDGSILFIAVPDEESYSRGMRAAAELMADIKEKNKLDYKLLINPEPTDLVDENQVMFMGTVGKIMPVVMVQGISSHIGHCFDGFNPLSMLTGIYQQTNGSLVFADRYKDEATMPPTWLKMRDLKDVYDVSIPLRAAGYFTVLSLTSGPGDILNKLTAICSYVAEEEVHKLEQTYAQYKKINRFETKSELGIHPRVYSFNELRDELTEKDGQRFTEFYNNAYEQIDEEIASGRTNYPDGTIMLMEKVLDFAGFTDPVVVIAFAPPYYPAVNGNMVSGKEFFAKKAYDIVSGLSAEDGQQVSCQNFFMGISDNSYTAVTGDESGNRDFAAAAPLWGHAYNINFDAVKKINVPAVIYGPIGKEYHKWSERVNKKSLLCTVPRVTRELIKQAWYFE